MAKHEFGIMQEAPQAGRRYDSYELQRYHAISVDDAYIEDIAFHFGHIECCWHTVDVKGKGLDYCGVTLIPPRSLEAFIDVIRDIQDLDALRKLMKEALYEDKWVIHFGI